MRRRKRMNRRHSRRLFKRTAGMTDAGRKIHARTMRGGIRL